jgi:hypothetical protein
MMEKSLTITVTWDLVLIYPVPGRTVGELVESP